MSPVGLPHLSPKYKKSYSPSQSPQSSSSEVPINETKSGSDFHNVSLAASEKTFSITHDKFEIATVPDADQVFLTEAVEEYTNMISLETPPPAITTPPISHYPFPELKTSFSQPPIAYIPEAPFMCMPQVYSSPQDINSADYCHETSPVLESWSGDCKQSIPYPSIPSQAAPVDTMSTLSTSSGQTCCTSSFAPVCEPPPFLNVFLPTNSQGLQYAMKKSQPATESAISTNSQDHETVWGGCTMRTGITMIITSVIIIFRKAFMNILYCYSTCR